MWKVLISHEADKTLRRMPKNTAQLIIDKLEKLTANPYAPNANVKRLQNSTSYRLRVGDWRVLYDLYDNVLVIEVIKIGPRGGFY